MSHLSNLRDNSNPLYPQQQRSADPPTFDQLYDPLDGNVVEQGAVHVGVHSRYARHPGEYINNPVNYWAKLNAAESLPSTSSQQLDGSSSYTWGMLYTDPSRPTQHAFNVDQTEWFSEPQNHPEPPTATQEEVVQFEAHHRTGYHSYDEPIDDGALHGSSQWSPNTIYGHEFGNIIPSTISGEQTGSRPMASMYQTFKENRRAENSAASTPGTSSEPPAMTEDELRQKEHQEKSQGYRDEEVEYRQQLANLLSIRKEDKVRKALVLGRAADRIRAFMQTEQEREVHVAEVDACNAAQQAWIAALEAQIAMLQARNAELA